MDGWMDALPIMTINCVTAGLLPSDLRVTEGRRGERPASADVTALLAATLTRMLSCACITAVKRLRMMGCGARALSHRRWLVAVRRCVVCVCARVNEWDVFLVWLGFFHFSEELVVSLSVSANLFILNIFIILIFTFLPYCSFWLCRISLCLSCVPLHLLALSDDDNTFLPFRTYETTQLTVLCPVARELRDKPHPFPSSSLPSTCWDFARSWLTKGSFSCPHPMTFPGLGGTAGAGSRTQSTQCVVLFTVPTNSVRRELFRVSKVAFVRLVHLTVLVPSRGFHSFSEGRLKILGIAGASWPGGCECTLYHGTKVL